MNRSTTTFPLPATRLLALAAAVVLLCQVHASAQAKSEYRMTVNMPDCRLSAVLRALSDMTGAKFVFPPAIAESEELVTLRIKDGALAEALDALGLDWEMHGDIIVVKGMKASETAPTGPQAEIDIAPVYELHQSWEVWRGDLPREVADTEFVPEAMTITEDGSRLEGSVADLVADLKKAGLAISIDPNAPETIGKATIEIAWRRDATTVEQVLLRGLISALAEQVDLAVIQRRDADGALLPTLRLVARRQTVSARPAATRAIPFHAPYVFYDEYGLRTVVYPNAAGHVELRDGTRLPLGLTEGKITIDTKDAALPDLIGMLSAATDTPMALDDGVNAGMMVTLLLQDVPVLHALTALVDQADLRIEVRRGETGKFEGFLFVPREKAPAAAIRACPEDGTRLQPDWRFCPICGRRTDGEPEPPPPPTPVPDDQADE